MNKIGFDNEKYLKLQSQNIRDRISKFGGKLYLEFGGKLFDDFHASRVVPGFKPDSKVNMLLEMKDDAEIVIAISADDIERSKRRGDLGITYDEDTLRLIDAFRGIGLYIGSVVITHYRGQAVADQFKKRLEMLGIIPNDHAYFQKNTELLKLFFGKLVFAFAERRTGTRLKLIICFRRICRRIFSYNVPRISFSIYFSCERVDGNI